MIKERTHLRPGEVLIGRSPCIKALRHHLPSLASHDVNVLIEGESGTGKELLSRSIHQASDRRAGPFVGVNCAAIHESLLESELFGHEAGAFTGARHATMGFLRAANGGTILLDEVGDMSISLQSKLLRVLEERAVVPVGGDREIPIDVRVIAATNSDLARAVESGAFRRDLYYRLNVVRLSIEPLRNRRQDISLLVRHMLARVAMLLGMHAKTVSQDAMTAMCRYDWPGNAREVGNVIQRAYVLGTGDTIELADLPEALLARKKEPHHGEDLFPPLSDAVRDHVKCALEYSGGVRTEAAKALGISRKTLWRMMHRFDIS
ncbi:MAG: sigma 54-interacting transcriptional regulator [Phycisphaerae bacterium]|nr:sigma 54-interacting transcriptional regulator [Phycisphaerae bacterium]